MEQLSDDEVTERWRAFNRFCEENFRGLSDEQQVTACLRWCVPCWHRRIEREGGGVESVVERVSRFVRAALPMWGATGRAGSAKGVS